MPLISVTPETRHAPMSSLKDAAAVLQSLHQQFEQEHDCAQNKYSMSVTSPVSHVEMWPYVASAAVASESHAATAHLSLWLTLTFPVLATLQSP